MAESVVRRDAEDAAAERRQLTVLFCDLAESTSLSERFDPEDLRQLLRAYQDVCSEVVEELGGHIAQYLGDGVLVYFGYPRAHEDDAPRAVRAGLGIVAAIAELNVGLERDRQIRLAVRVGIHTGPVVTGEVGGGSRREVLATGKTPNIAARLQSFAKPGSVVLSAATRDLVAGQFDLRSLGEQQVRGLSQAVEVFTVVGESKTSSPFEVSLSVGLTPLVGREREIGQLEECYERARLGSAQVVLVCGEAGIGKSRVLHGFKERLAPADAGWFDLRCASYYRNTAFYPIVGFVREICVLADDSSPEEQLSRLEQALEGYGLVPREAVALLAPLLSLPWASPDQGDMTPQRQKQKTLEAILALLAAAAQSQPVVLVVEDLHWIDPSTRELLDFIVEHAGETRLLMLLSFRPSFVAPWTPGPSVTRIDLENLSEDLATALVRRIMGADVLPPVVVRQLIAKADGVPLYVEELTRTALEVLQDQPESSLSGTLALKIPATLQDSLMARLDRLAPVKTVAQVGAVIGREFDTGLVRAISTIREPELSISLEQLVAGGILLQRGSSPRATYVFRHALIQDAAYDSLLKSTRQKHHRRLAEVFERQSPETCHRHPELLAHHFTQAAMAEKAVVYWLRAGQQASERYANLEAAEHFRQGLELLADLPANPARQSQELAFQAGIGSALQNTLGYSAPEVERAYARAHHLSEQLGDTPQLLRVVLGLWMFYAIRGGYSKALELAKRLLRLAEPSSDPALHVQGYYSVGYSRYLFGDLAQSREDMTRALALTREDGERSFMTPLGDDIRVHIRGQLAMVSWVQGQVDEAVRCADRSVELARASAHPFGLTFALTLGAWVHQLRRDPEAVRIRAREGVEISEEKGLNFWLPHCTFLLAWARCWESIQGAGGPAEVLDDLQTMRGALDSYRLTGARNGQMHMFIHLAEMYARLGWGREGLQILNEGRVALGKHVERVWESELGRVHGELLLCPEDGGESAEEQAQAEAESQFQQALSVASSRGARSLELRAALSLGRLWRRQGRAADAHRLLVGVHGGFTEGHDTSDVHDARELAVALEATASC